MIRTVAPTPALPYEGRPYPSNPISGNFSQLVEASLVAAAKENSKKIKTELNSNSGEAKRKRPLMNYTSGQPNFKRVNRIMAIAPGRFGQEEKSPHNSIQFRREFASQHMLRRNPCGWNAKNSQTQPKNRSHLDSLESMQHAIFQEIKQSKSLPRNQKSPQFTGRNRDSSNCSRRPCYSRGPCGSEVRLMQAERSRNFLPTNDSASYVDGFKRSGCTEERKPAKFILRLAQMVNDKGSDHICLWAEDGKSFFASDSEEFCKLRSRHLFGSPKFDSFVRQLHNYGFHRQKLAGQDLKDGGQRYKFWHPYFLDGQPRMLSKIQRGRHDTVPQISSSPHENAPSAEVVDMRALSKGLAAISKQLQDMGSMTKQIFLSMRGVQANMHRERHFARHQN